MITKVSLPNHVLFEDGSDEITFQLQDGPRGISEGGSQPSTLNITGGGKRFGDFEPNFSHLEQRTWVGGRGVENYVEDQTGFFDSQNLWSLTPNKIFPAPMWKFAQGVKTADEDLGVDRTWKKLIDASRYVSVAIGAITSADYANLWVRRRGSPGTLTLELRADSGGEAEGTLHQTVTKTVTDITDTISVFEEFNWTSTQTLSAGDHIKIYGASTDTTDNCWEVAVDTTGTGSKISADSATWASAGYTMLHRLSVADTARRWIDFDLEGAKYAVSINDSTAASVLMINGGRGTASAGGATTLTDSGIAWTADRWIGAWVKIIGGTGKGQYRQITDNTTEILTVATWDTNPDATSRYVIYKTPWWTTLGTTGLGKVTDVAVINNIVYFAQGTTAIRRMYDNAGTPAYDDDGTNVADFLWPFYDAADGAQLWRAINGVTMQVSRASVAAWGTDLVFGTGIQVGSIDQEITNMIDYNNQLWVFKEDKVWYIQNDRAVPLAIGTEGLPGKETGQAVAVHNLFLWFSWWKSAERMYGATVDDEGVWRKGSGLPSGRNGSVSGLVALLPWLFQSIDAGTGTSSVLIYKDGAYHEMFRGFKAGHRIRNIFASYHRGDNPWLWIDYNGELLYQEYSLTPLQESSFDFQHEAVVVSGTHDMGHAETYKFFKDLSAQDENFDQDGIYTAVDYQYGKDVNTSTWINANSFYNTPTDVSEIEIGETNALRYRLRMYTDDASTPPIINATVLKGYEVLPVKRLWNLRIKASSLLSRGKSTSPDKLYDWLWASSQKAKKIRMYTSIPNVNNVLVKLEPPNTFWRFVNKASKWTGVFAVSVREM